MCLAIPGQIKTIEAGRHFAVAEVSRIRRRVNIELLAEDGLAEDDWVLIHVGFAMSMISANEAEEQIQLLTLLGEAGAALEEVQGYNFEEPPETP